MNAYRAVKSDFVPSSEVETFRNRESAIANAIEGVDASAVHEHAPDPMIYRAASELIRLDDEGHKTDIEAQGKPYDVLTQVAEKLMEAGASRFAAGRIFETLESYITGLGADFARQAKAKPLYARVMVTDQEPKDIPDCALTSVTCIDGARVQGSDASRVVLQNTIYGTRMSQSSSMSMDKVFESGKQKWLLIYYGTIEDGNLNGFDTVDADATALVQAVGPAAAASAAGGEIREAIENGTIAPEMADLVRNIAELNRLTEAAKTPGAVEDVSAKIAELKAVITQLTQTISNFEAIPPVLAAAIVTAFEQSEPAALAVQDVGVESVQDIIAAIVADNDNQIENVVEQSNDIIEKIKTLLKDEALPADIKEVLSAVVEKADKAVEENDIKVIAQSLTEIRQTIADVAASETLPQTTFKALADIAPVVAVVEKKAIDVLPETRAEKILQAIEVIESKIESGAIDQNDPAMAELIKSVTDIKEALKGENREAVVQKIVEVLEKKPEVAALSVAVATLVQKMSEPAILEKMPADIKADIVKNIVEIKSALQIPQVKQPEIVAKKIDAIVLPKQPEGIRAEILKFEGTKLVAVKPDIIAPLNAISTSTPRFSKMSDDVSPARKVQSALVQTPSTITKMADTVSNLAGSNNKASVSADIAARREGVTADQKKERAPDNNTVVKQSPFQQVLSKGKNEISPSVDKKEGNGFVTPIKKQEDTQIKREQKENVSPQTAKRQIVDQNKQAFHVSPEKQAPLIKYLQSLQKSVSVPEAKKELAVLIKQVRTGNVGYESMNQIAGQLKESKTFINEINKSVIRQPQEMPQKISDFIRVEVKDSVERFRDRMRDNFEIDDRGDRFRNEDRHFSDRYIPVKDQIRTPSEYNKTTSDCGGCDGKKGCCTVFNVEAAKQKAIDIINKSYGITSSANEEQKSGCGDCDGKKGCCTVFNVEAAKEKARQIVDKIYSKDTTNKFSSDLKPANN